jgi:general secretion pathway protein A
MSNNIAEGSGCSSKKEFRKFLDIARRSTFENANILILLSKRDLISERVLEQLLDKLDHLCRQITNFGFFIVTLCALRSALCGELRAMYETYYGLKENPFNVTPDPKFIYLGENHQEALAHLLYGVEERKGFIVITGEVGSGKTTLIHYLLNELIENDNTKTAYLFNTKLNTNDFIQYILKDLGVEVNGGTKSDYLYSLYQYLLKAYQNNEKVILIVDEAQGLNPKLLEEIRLLSNFETSKSKLLQIILVGQPELKKMLLHPGLRQLRQRINLRYHLNPLSEKETKGYIEKRLRVAGAKGRLFTEKAIEEIYRISGGIPRLINILCDNSLLNGYALDQKIVDDKSVGEAARDLNLKSGSSRLWTWTVVPLCIVGVALIIFLLWKSGLLLPLHKGILKNFQNIGNAAINGFQNVLYFFK